MDKHGNRFEGSFANDQKEGQGKEMFVNGTEYRGEYRANMFNGKGMFTWPDGSSYEGDWVDNKMNGKVGHFLTCRGLTQLQTVELTEATSNWVATKDLEKWCGPMDDATLANFRPENETAKERLSMGIKRTLASGRTGSKMEKGLSPLTESLQEASGGMEN